MYKFRTMHQTPISIGGSVSPQGDPRVTEVGRMLRRLKFNEFPQFINVLKGDMTLIGPRPEAPDLAVRYPDFARKIFSVKPGLAGPNQILGRNEEELYPPGVDPVKFYIEHILPAKLPLDLEYINDPSIFKNLKYLFLSVKVTITGAINRQHLVDNRTQLLFMLCDIVLCLVSFTLAHSLRYDGFHKPEFNHTFFRILPWVVLIRVPIFICFGFYHTLVRHLSFYDIKVVFKGVAVSSLILIGFFFFYRLAVFAEYGRGVFLIDWFCLTNFLAGYRILLMKFHRYHKVGASNPEDYRRVLIWGAGDGGELCLQYLQKEQDHHYEVIGFIDDDPKKINSRMNGTKVLGSKDHLPILIELYKVQEVFVAMPSVGDHEKMKALEFCHKLGVEAKLFQLSAMTYAKHFPQPASANPINDSLSSRNASIALGVATSQEK